MYFNVLTLKCFVSFASYQMKPTVVASSEEANNFIGPPPGMSEAAYNRVTGKSPPTADELENVSVYASYILYFILQFNVCPAVHLSKTVSV